MTSTLIAVCSKYSPSIRAAAPSSASFIITCEGPRFATCCKISWSLVCGSSTSSCSSCLSPKTTSALAAISLTIKLARASLHKAGLKLTSKLTVFFSFLLLSKTSRASLRVLSESAGMTPVRWTIFVSEIKESGTSSGERLEAADPAR